MIQEFFLGNSRNIFLNLIFVCLPCHFRCSRYRFAYAIAISFHGKIEVRKDGFQLHGVGFLKGFVEKRLGNLKSNKIAIGVRCITPFGNFEDVEAEFRSEVCHRILVVDYGVSIFRAQFGVQHGHGEVHGYAMALVVRGVMRESTQGKSIFVQILRVAYQGQHKIAGADIMNKIAE